MGHNKAPVNLRKCNVYGIRYVADNWDVKSAYTCNVLGCTKSYKSAYTFRRHMSDVHAEKGWDLFIAVLLP